MGTLHDLDEYRKKKKWQQNTGNNQKAKPPKQTIFQKILEAIHGKWMSDTQAQDLCLFLMEEFELKFEDMKADDKLVLAEHARKRRASGAIGRGGPEMAGILIYEIKIYVHQGLASMFKPEQALIVVRNLKAIYGV